VIAKISQGKGFRGALDYIFKGDAEKVGGNMSGEDSRSLAAEFGVTRKLREDIETCCYHVSLSLPAGEELSAKEWEKISVKYLARMGLDPTSHQYTVVRHRDGDFDHVHIVTSRIALDGSVWKPFRDRIKSKNICRQLEVEHKLTPVSNEKKIFTAQTTQKERRMAARTGREPEKVLAQQILSEVLPDGGTMDVRNFCTVLEARGVIAIPNIATTGRVSGFAFQHAGRQYTGSQIGHSWKHLEKRLSIGADDIQWMRDRRQHLQEGTPADAVRSIRNAVWEFGILNTPFEKALEKQGWRIEESCIRKGAASYEIASIVDEEVLNRNLQELGTFSKAVKEKAQAKARSLAAHFHDSPQRRAFLAEMRTEDVVCAMIMFPEVVLFLLLLSALTAAVRDMERPKDEVQFRAQMKEIWAAANADVEAEVQKIKGEIRNAGVAGRHSKHLDIDEKAGRRPGDARGDGGPRVHEVGGRADGDYQRGTRRDSSDERGREKIALEAKNIDVHGVSGVSRGDGAFPSGADDTELEQTAVPPGVTAVAVEEWASLAQDLSILTRGDEGDDVAKEKSKSVAYKEQVWARQHSALQAPAYRVTVRGRGAEDGKTINLCKHKDGTETVWTADEVKNQIPSLEYWNAKGYDVYITPMDEDYHHILIDDLTAAGVEHLRESGFSPCLVQTSSENNYQAIIRVPKAKTSPEEQSAGNVLLQKLNTWPDGCGGDRAISAPRHPFRMTGFNNKKPSRNNVQTKIELLRPGAVCEKAASMLAAIRAEREAALGEAEVQRRRRAIETTADLSAARPDGENASEKDFRFRWNKHSGLAKKKKEEGLWEKIDHSTIDYRVCREMLEQGYCEEETAAALLLCSPALHRRHSNPADYTRRTIAAAAKAAEVPAMQHDDGR